MDITDKILVLKHTEGKLPFIGVLFDSEGEALINANFVDDYPKAKFTLVYEASSQMTLRLVAEKESLFQWYRRLEYNGDEFKKWRTYIHLGVNFGHCYLDEGVLKVAKTPGGKWFVIQISLFIS